MGSKRNVERKQKKAELLRDKWPKKREGAILTFRLSAAVLVLTLCLTTVFLLKDDDQITTAPWISWLLIIAFTFCTFGYAVILRAATVIMTRGELDNDVWYWISMRLDDWLYIRLYGRTKSGRHIPWLRARKSGLAG